MTARRLFAFAWGAVALGAALASGCSDESTAPNTNAGDPDLSEQFGGYTTSDEEPAFGDPQLLEDLAGEVAVDDGVADDPETRDLEGDPEGKAYAITLRWGILERKVNGDLGGQLGLETVDWSGSLTASAGRIVLRHLYSFEAEDHAVLPRDNPALLEWVSRTSGGVDGLTVLVLLPGDLGDPSNETLTLDTAAFDATFTFEELADLDTTFAVGEDGNQIRINAMENRAAVSTRGWLLGRWGWDEDAGVGVFAGQWVHPRTGISGFLRGHYEPSAETDEIVFYGKYISRSGRFEGFLRGTVDVTRGTIRSGVGHFEGGWYSETGEAEGSVRGRWVSDSPRGGYFSGMWCSGCPVRDEAGHGLGHGNGPGDGAGNGPGGDGNGPGGDGNGPGHVGGGRG